MLRIDAPNYVRIGGTIEHSRVNSIINNPDLTLNNWEVEQLLKTLRSLRSVCAQVRLPVSLRILDRTIEEFTDIPPQHSLEQQRMNEWSSAFMSELETGVFMYVLPHRVGYWQASEWDGEPFSGDEIGRLLDALAASFEDAIFDAKEAGTCFAYARFTACVYHLMRVAEHGLISVAVAANVPRERISKGWDGCIQGIQSTIKLLESTKPTPDWQEQKKQYSDFTGWFITIRNGWRNPVSHVPRIYSEDSARGIFAAVTTLFQHLASAGFAQTTMPREVLLSPADNEPA